MIVALAAAVSAGVFLAVAAVRVRGVRRVVVVAVVVLAGLTAWAPVRVAAAGGSTLFAQSFANNTVSTAYPVSTPTSPNGTNNACLTASGNSSGGVLRSCPANNDAQGAGKLRLTAASSQQEGGVFSATSVPTSQGIDATFNTYQYGGNGADGIGFVLAAVNPADPLSPPVMGSPGGSLGYSASGGKSGLAEGYLGIGLDVYGKFSESVYEGTGCTDPAYIATNGNPVPGQVVVRGPGNGTVGYCAVNSTATTTSSPPLALRASTRAASVVPVEVVINPTTASFTTTSGIAVAAGAYKVVFTPVGGSATTLSGTLPTVPAGLYPSSSWTTSSGIPRQLAFGWVGSTGGPSDFHEIDAANVVSFGQVPQLAVAQTAYSAASPALGAPVTYTVTPGISSSGASETSPVSVSMTLPAGVTPAGAYGPGWTCSAPSGQVITCTDSSPPFAAGASLPLITIQGIVTSSGVTASSVQSGTVVTASSADGDPGYAGSATAGTLPAAPSGVTASPASGTISGGNVVTVSGSNISGATAIEIGTTAQQQAGTPVVLLPCPSGPAAGCFTVNGNGSLNISSMPAVASPATVNVTVVTLGIAGAASYVYNSTPGTPAAPAATAGITSATVTWTAPASNGSTIASYVVTPYLNGTAQTPQSYDASTTTRTLTGLTAGASYTFTVAAVNAVGTGPASVQSAAVVPYTLPGAPVIGPVSAGDSAATVTWTAPSSNGGSAITGYAVTPYIAGVAQAAQTFTSTATTETATGLSPGTSYTFTVAAVNAAGPGPASGMSGAVTVNAGPSLTFTAPPAGEAGVGYSDQLTAAGGTGALTWSVSAGGLPPGLSLSPSTGLLSGTPTTAGSYAFTVKVADAAGGSATQAATVTIAAAPSLANPAPPTGQAAVTYSDALSVTGGTGPFTWTVSGGSLPPGLTLNSSAGLLSGTPTAPGLYTFTVRVTDTYGLTATQTLSMSVATGPLVISASANTSTVAQGGTVGYTVTITNTAASAYSGVTYSIPLSDVLDDAVYNGDAAATAGSVSYANSSLTWTGNLAAGASATVTFSAAVSNPGTGNHTLSFTVTSPTTGTNCPANGTDARCGASVPVAALTIMQTATPAAAAPGTVVSYTVTVTNSGQVAYTGAAFADPLTQVLDDAVYNGDAAATAGSVSYASPSLTWTGNLAAGATATVTFSVTVNNPDTGDKILTSTITSGTAGSDCAAGSTDTRCTATVAVQGLTIASTANAASATPGATVQYTVTVTNSGQASYPGASISDALTGVLDDAAYNGDAAATSGAVSLASPNLTWTGNLAPGATATITFSVTVNNPDAGDKTLTTAITSPTAASNCPAGGPGAACGTTVSVLVPALTIAMSAGVSSTTPGATVAYTVTLTNSGQTAYTGTSAAVSLAGILDDAAYNADATATTGTLSFTSPNVTWTGDLAPGATATIALSVTVSNPDTGNRVLNSRVTSAAAGSNCPSGSTDPRCTASVPVLVPGLTLAVSANTASAVAGGTVQYTVTAGNTGQTTDSGVSFADSLSGVLDDATYNGDASATTGTVSFTSPNLTWTGTLAPGATATITFSVTVNSPDTGNKILASTVTSAATGNNCPTGGTDPSCASVVMVASLVIANTASTSTTTPGGVVRYTATFTNTGQAPYTGITIATGASDVFDDATPNGDQTATSGTLVLASAGISWTGSIPVGGTVTATGTVTVNNPDVGNHLMTSTLVTSAAGSNCPSGGTDPACAATVTVQTPGLTITNTASTSSTTPGSTVGYTVTIADTGQTSYTGITVADDLSGALTDAAYNGDAAATAGSVSYASPVLSWTGDLSPGGSVTVTFSVTVSNPDTGDKAMVAVATSGAAGSSCPPGTTAAGCRSLVSVLTPALTITTSASTSSAVPGGTVQYTVTVTDTGQTPYTGATVTDSLTGLLDDAAYNGDAAATAGSVSYASPVLSWTGDLSPGGSATVTFSVTVSNPDTGDRILTSTVTSADQGNNCPSGSTDARCATTVGVESAALLTITASSDAASVPAGGVVHYTVTVNNAAATTYSGASFTDSLSGVLDDAAYNADASATTGTASFTSPDLTWTGDLAAGATATITFSVTVNSPDTGNKTLTSTVTSAAVGSNCGSGNTDARCANAVAVASLEIANSVSPGTVTPGGVIRFTGTFTNTGQAPYYGITVSAPVAGVADDTVPNGDQTATSGTLSLDATAITWTGDIPVGGTVTITGSLTVDNPDTGDGAIASAWVTAAPGSNCPSGSTDPACGATATVETPGLTISNTASVTTTVPGSTVGYTVTIADTGQTSYTGISVADDLTGTLDDAAYNGDAAATAGSVSYASPVLTWTGDLSPGGTVTITFSVTVSNPDTGDKLLVVDAASGAAGSTCPPGTTAAPCRSSAGVLTPALTIVSTADTPATAPGGTVHYTVTITDSGQTPYAGISVADDLGGVLDDAAYNGDASATAGTVSLASPDLTWTGDLSPGGTVTVTFSATVNDPDAGNKTLSSTVTSAASGNNCPTGSGDPNCATTVPVSVMTITNTAATGTTTPGTAVTYTVTVTNSGQTALTGAALTVPLSDVLDDAAYSRASATIGTVSFTSPDLTWTGDLNTGQAATISIRVVVNNPDTGNKTLTDTVTSATPGSTCPSSGTGPAACTAAVTVLVPGLTITKTADSSTTTPGSTVRYTVTVADSGQTSYAGAVVTDDLGGVLNDAVYNGDAVATIGSVSYAGPVLTWTGDLAPGDTATVTYSVTVDNPDTGDKHIVSTVTSAAAGSTCPPGGTNPACTVTVTDLIPALTITKTANVASATPGSAVGYTVTVSDSGQTSYVGAVVTDDLGGVLNDAAYNGDAVATAGAVSYASPVLTWTGNLAPGDTATVTYSVTVNNPDTGGTSLTNTVTSAAAGSSCPLDSSGGQCTVTVGIVSGPLSITAPAATDLGSGPPGATIQAPLGTIQVTDDRGFGADWSTSVASSDFTTGSGAPAEIIPVGDATYAVSGLDTAAGPATFGYVPQIGLSENPQGVVNVTGVEGNTTVTWNPVVQVAVPGGAIGGAYSATIVHSVS